MYSQCPNCQTVFRVGTQQLRAAAGKVRCGRCSEIFDSLVHRTAWEPEGVDTGDLPLNSPVPEPSAPVSDRNTSRKSERQPTPTSGVKRPAPPNSVEKPGRGAELSAAVRPRTAAPQSEARQTGPDGRAEKPKGEPIRRAIVRPQVATPPSETRQASPPEGAEILKGESGRLKTVEPQAAAPPSEPSQTSRPEDTEKPKGDSGRRTAIQFQAAAPEQASQASPPQGAEKPGKDRERPARVSFGIRATRKPADAVPNKHDDSSLYWEPDLFAKENIEALLHPANEESESSRQAAEPVSENKRNRHGAVEIQTEDTERPPPEEHRPPAPKEGPEQPKSRFSIAGDEELPLQLQARPDRDSGIGATLVWSIIVLLAVAALGVQYTYFNRDQLAFQAQWRPYVETLCEVVGCELPPRRKLSAVQLIDHAVQSHPRHDGALLITATLLNGAEFPQPYPDVEITMMDVEQHPVASRRFTPAEYLTGRNPDDLFAAGRDAHLVLEVIDPGSRAVSFEFDFH